MPLAYKLYSNSRDVEVHFRISNDSTGCVTLWEGGMDHTGLLNKPLKL